MQGRHRYRYRSQGFRTTAVAVALVVVAAGVWVGLRQLDRAACSGEVRIGVAAAPEINPTIKAAAARWVAAGAAVDGVCVAVDVNAVEPVDVAAVVADKHGTTLTGIGQASGTAVMPDVWISDSFTWLLRLKAAASGFTPTAATSIARSPVVVAMPELVASDFGWPTAKLTWANLFQRIRTDTRLRTGTVEPTRDAAALSGLLALGAVAAASGANAQQASTSLLRALATGRSTVRQDLLAKFPQAADAAAISSGVTAAALSEQAVISYNAAKPPVPLAALYLEPAPPALDYPYAVMPGLDPAKAAAANGLRSALSGAAYLEGLAAQGLRAADGSAGRGFAAPVGAPNGVAPSPTGGSSGTAAGGPDPAVVERILGTWTTVTLPARMLAVIDVSGSMLRPVPTARNATRAQVTVAAARAGLGLLDDSWAVGLWIFSTELDGNRDWRQLVPIGPLSSQRSLLTGALGRITPKRNGNTGLYDTLADGYRTVKEGWEPGRVNSLVIFTDGENEDNSGRSREQLVAELKKMVDKAQPVQVVIIAIGTEVNPAVLKPVTDATGRGAVFVVEDPARIPEVFLRAVSLRTAR